MRPTRTDDRDVAPELRKAIERTGYYPEVVHDAVRAEPNITVFRDACIEISHFYLSTG